MIPNEELCKKLSVNIIMVVDRNWSVFPCKQVPFLRYNRLNIEKFQRMNTIAHKAHHRFFVIRCCRVQFLNVFCSVFDNILN